MENYTQLLLLPEGIKDNYYVDFVCARISLHVSYEGCLTLTLEQQKTSWNPQTHIEKPALEKCRSQNLNCSETLLKTDEFQLLSSF